MNISTYKHQKLKLLSFLSLTSICFSLNAQQQKNHKRKKCQIINHDYSNNPMTRYLKKSASLIDVIEIESNDINTSIDQAQFIPNFRTNPTGTNQANITIINPNIPIDATEVLSAPILDIFDSSDQQEIVEESDEDEDGVITSVRKYTEDKSIGNDDFSTATPLFENTKFTRKFIVQNIGDGPHGIKNGSNKDFDIYKIKAHKNDSFDINVSSSLDFLSDNFSPVALLVDKDGKVLEVTAPFQNEIIFNFEIETTAYVIVTDLKTLNPTLDAISKENISKIEIDASKRTNTTTEFGQYTLDVIKSNFTPLYYSVDLFKGDLLFINSNNSHTENLKIFSPNGQLAFQNSFIFSNETLDLDDTDRNLVPKLSTALTLSYIIPKNGRYTFQILNENYLSSKKDLNNQGLKVIATRPRFELKAGTRDIIYLDFTGEELYSIPSNDEDFLSADSSLELQSTRFRETEIEYDTIDILPTADFFDKFGLENNALVKTRMFNKLFNIVKNDFEQANTSETNPNFDVTFISDFGDPILGDMIPKMLHENNINYNTVFIGGTSEVGINPGGVTRDFDPGNFSNRDTAITYVEEIAGPFIIDGESVPGVIDDIKFKNDIDKETFIAEYLASVTSHEIAHFIGLEHTTIADENKIPSIMDASTNPSSLVNENNEFENLNIDFSKFLPDQYNQEENQFGINLVDLNVSSVLGYLPVNNDETKKQNAILNKIKEMESKTLSILTDSVTLSVTNFPNPQSIDEDSNLTIFSNTNEHTKVSLYDIKGTKISDIFNGKIEKGTQQKIKIDPTQYNLGAGIYIYIVETPNEKVGQKLLISN